MALDRVAQEAGNRDLFEMEAESIERLFDQFEPAGQSYGEYEYLFEAFWKKSKKAAKSGSRSGRKGRKKRAGGIKQKLLSRVIGILKKVFRMILNKVLDQAIGRLPANLRPAARKLRSRFLGGGKAKRDPRPSAPVEDSREPDEDVSSAPVDDASLEPDEGAGEASENPASLAEAANTEIVASLFEFDSELEAESDQEFSSETQGLSPAAELSMAREQFMQALAQAKEGEDLAPHVEGFLPAIVPALKMASRFGLRKVIAKLLGKLIAKFIQKTVGQQSALPLGQAIASAGLKMMGFETNSAAERSLVPSLLAQTVEGTVQRLGESVERLGLAERDLENPALLEAMASQAFEQAAAANWPGRMMRPELRESSEPDDMWVLAPAKGKKYYKRGPSRKITIDPKTAENITIFAGKTLADFLYVEKGLARKPLQAILWMYEAIPGSTLSHIALFEKNVPGLGNASKAAWSQIHPLTSDAAGQLTGSAGLGRKFTPKWMASPHMIQIGLRYYYLRLLGSASSSGGYVGGNGGAGSEGTDDAVGGSSPSTTTGEGQEPSQINTVVDCQNNKIIVSLFFAEPQAQRVAASFRAGQTEGVVFQAVTAVLDAAAQNAADGKGKHIKVIPKTQQLFKRRRRPVLNLVMQWFRKRFFKWAGRVIVKIVEKEIESFRTSFIKAADDPAWGVTVRIELDNPPAMEAICAALAGQVKLPPMEAVEIPKAYWSTIAGFRRE